MEITYTISYIIVLIVVYFFLKHIKVREEYAMTFSVTGALYLSASAWEVNNLGGNINFLIYLWVVSYGIMMLSYLRWYFQTLNNKFSKENIKKLICFGLFLLGCSLFWSVLEDLACYIFIGFDEFNQSGFAGQVHKEWFLGLPTFYWWYMIIGVMLVIMMMKLSN